jgi:hypothetical protein
VGIRNVWCKRGRLRLLRVEHIVPYVKAAEVEEDGSRRIRVSSVDLYQYSGIGQRVIYASVRLAF